ncbi:hypothetical protein AIOL_001644 [Candidatus Rhodobacter oscarellae]|uniref:Uncharacterized protein n=1 Tax=Candidatus Rhodobacter oscarellae TaxID=1675527 RepID=A0A0J9E4B3_9RHOB|nr:hypothetical protein AIOL_001644 [Candidatus Rhodobacter lobularis]
MSGKRLRQKDHFGAVLRKLLQEFRNFLARKLWRANARPRPDHSRAPG